MGYDIDLALLGQQANHWEGMSMIYDHFSFERVLCFACKPPIFFVVLVLNKVCKGSRPHLCCQA